VIGANSLNDLWLLQISRLFDDFSWGRLHQPSRRKVRVDSPADGLPLRSHLTDSERARIIDRWYEPYHRVDVLIAIERAASSSTATASPHGLYLSASCSKPTTMSSAYRMSNEPEQDPDRPDICIRAENRRLDMDEQSREAIAELWQDQASHF
jgi:hypothetical protein